jgi:hypothetical protein
VGHDAGGREGHVDARWRLRHRVVFNGGLGLRVCVQLGLVVVVWVVEVRVFRFLLVGAFCLLFGLSLYGCGGGCVVSAR